MSPTRDGLHPATCACGAGRTFDPALAYPKRFGQQQIVLNHKRDWGFEVSLKQALREMEEPGVTRRWPQGDEPI